MSLSSKIIDEIDEKQVIKVVTGLNNLNINKIMQRVKAAEVAKATYVDVAANPTILNEIRKKSQIPICVSSIDFNELYSCFYAGANILEIGNFGAFYKNNITLSNQHILYLADKLVTKVPNIPICVTIPCYLSLLSQISLARQLQAMGVQLIQTEGYGYYSKLPLIHSFKNACLSLSSTYVLNKTVHIPLISASNMNSLSAPVAISCGASAVAIGSFLHINSNLFSLSQSVYSILRSIKLNKSLYIQSGHIILYHYIECSNIILNRIKVRKKLFYDTESI